MARGRSLSKRNREWLRMHRAWVTENCPDWEENESMKMLYAGVPNPTTQFNLRRGLWPFFGWLGIEYGIKSPDEAISLRRSQRDTEDYLHFERVIQSYKQVLVGLDYSLNSIKTKLGIPFSFFAHNGLPLQVGKKFFSADPSDAAKQRRRTREWPRRDEVSRAYDIADIEDKAIILLGYQWGLNNSDIIGMSWENLSLEQAPEGEDFYRIDWVREKSGEPSDKVMNPDIKWALTQLWELQNKPKSGLVFTNPKGETYTPQSINLKWRALTEQAVSSERAEALPFKTLRRSYNEAILLTDATQEIKDALMGHKRRGARRNYPVANLIETYRKAFQHLTVNGWSHKEERDREIDQTLLEQSTEIASQSKTLESQQDVIDALTTAVKMLKTQNEELQKSLEDIKGRIVAVKIPKWVRENWSIEEETRKASQDK